MCLSEPQAGSSLSDIATRAVPDGDDFESDPLGPRYRLRGNKMWISNGEHELTENIVHLVLAKIPGAGRQAGARHARHLALHRAEEAGRRRRARSPASATTSRWPASTTSSATAASPTRCSISARASSRCDGAAGADRLPRRPARRGPALHVPHDERGAHRRRPRRDDARLRRLRGLARLRQGRGRRAGRSAPAARTPRSRRCRSSSTPTSSACCWRRRAIAKARWRSSSTARAWSTSSTPATPGRASAAAPAARGADADRQELAERVVPGGEQPGDPGASAATATRATSRSSSTGATTAST